MRPQSEIRARVDRVTSYPPAERERIYQKYFSAPSATVRFLCQRYGLDTKAVLDVCCHYGYHLVHFGDNSAGLDGSPQYLQFAREMGLNVQDVNVEERFPEYPEPFDALFFAGTLEEVLSPHVVLMRFHQLLKPDGLLCLRVPTVPPAWFDRLMQLRIHPGYAALAHLYFFTPRLLGMVVERAGYDVLQIASSALWLNPWTRPVHDLLLPYVPAVTLVARRRAGFVYPPVRAMRFLPSWAMDLAPFHEDYEPQSIGEK